ncbi:MAG: class I SAM-dependent DNA methyltransferase, partial [Bacteroidota bacterium]
FFHWELAFADVFASRGGFDLVLGNPPWLSIKWNEAGILGEVNPLFAIRKLNATEISKLRADAFTRFPGLQDVWSAELEQSEATQNFLNAVQNYPLLKGMKANLYKCFLPLSWKLSTKQGVAGFLHPEGPYEDPDGGILRENLYPRLRRHFQFINVKLLFQEVMIWVRYSINIYGNPVSTPRFETIANLFTPLTVDSCYASDGTGYADGIKDSAGNWNTTGHLDRIVTVDESRLGAFARLYDSLGTPAIRARLPALHAGRLSSVLQKLAIYPSRLGDLGSDLFSTQHWNEKTAKDDGSIERSAGRVATFPDSTEDWIISGPHFFVGNPFYKTPRKICDTPRAYDSLDLETLPDSFLPRTNY